MADPWELILHHTYAGSPGTAYDLSPGHGSHGEPVGDVRFFEDGASPGSGAMQAGNADSGIRVTCGGKEWAELGAVRGEVRFWQDAHKDSRFFQTLVACQWFNFGTYGPWWGPQQVWIYFFPDTPQFVRLLGGTVVPFRQWLTLGFAYDGRSTVQLTINGQAWKSMTGAFAPLPGLGTDLGIGNTLPGMPVPVHGNLLDGLIDEVKIWRRNPHRMGSDFLSGPRDGDTAGCWAHWGRALAAWLGENPDCAERLSGLLPVLDSALSAVTPGTDPALEARFESAVAQYRTLWRAGHVNDPAMAGVLLDIHGILRQAGVEPEAFIEQIIDSDCWRRLLAEVPPPDCDTDLGAVLSSTARQLGDRERHLRRRAAE
ncbi:LamG-like jellyroll fold domain-containing protein [Streptomyces roseoverticillatus]|uniref:LamG-like jellyroll fold domain-containing protein n=1 Tax=Streptomyces roseoverticillatus TaxID=66429 RepID=UPI0033C3F82D